MADLMNPNPETTQTANPPATTTAPAASTGTVQTSGQTERQNAPAEDRFGDVDPNTLPPQLKSVYDNMLRGWKDKTTRLSEERKKYEGYDAYKQKADLYDRVSSDQEFVRMWNERIEKASQANQNEQSDQTPDLKKEIQAIKSKLEQAELVDVVRVFEEVKNDKDELLHPDFQALNGIGIGKTPQGDEYSLLRACVELSPGNTPQEKLANGYKAAKAVRDKIYEEGRKSGMGKMLSRVRDSTETPSLSTDKTTFNGDARKLSVREARELAEKGVTVR